jgi:hypothetical protein
MSYGTEHECVILVLFHVILKFQRKKVERCAPFRVYEGALFAVLHSICRYKPVVFVGKLLTVQV